MKAYLSVVVVLFGAGCGLESIGGNLSHGAYERPASKVTGLIELPAKKLVILDADGKELTPFQQTWAGGAGRYELRLPSAKYQNLVVVATAGTATLRALLPAVGEESTVALDVNARSMTEALISEARLSAEKATWKQVTPEAYVGTRALIWGAFERPGPTQDLLRMVEKLIEKYTDPTNTGDPVIFASPVLNPDYTTKVSALDPSWVDRERPDVDGDGKADATSTRFDRLLALVAESYRPAGCPDPNRLRTVFTVDFNSGRKNGNCGVSERFKWAVDKPGKQMYFVGWLHKDSPNQDPLVAALLGSSTPNQVPMRDDGTGGDETAGDNVWTATFDLPRGARVGYKYTWGTRGAPWTGSEEWPGNSRLLEIVDVNGDDLVYRRDVFGDEATNKDRSNLNMRGNGIVDWTTNLRGFGLETRELQIDTNEDCTPDTWLQPKAVGPLTEACTQ